MSVFCLSSFSASNWILSFEPLKHIVVEELNKCSVYSVMSTNIWMTLSQESYFNESTKLFVVDETGWKKISGA